MTDYSVVTLWGRNLAHLLLRSLKTELFKSVGFNMEDAPEMFIGDTGEKTYTAIVRSHWRHSSLSWKSSTQKMVLKCLFISEGEETLYIHYAGLLGQRALQINRVYLDDASEIIVN